MPTAVVGDIRMYYELRGAGPPVVLVGGLGLDITQFGRIIGRLSERRAVLAFDNRGAGRADMPDVPY